MNNTLLSPRLQKLVDMGESGTDILHGELKNLMYECEQVLSPLTQNMGELVGEIGCDEDLTDFAKRKYNEGYLDALTKVYILTYELAFSISDRSKNANV
jgi:hypothetical protein